MNQKHPTSDSQSPPDKLAAIKDTVSHVADNLKTAGIERAGEALDAAKHQVEDISQKLWQDAQASQVYKDANRYVQDKPMNALLIAFGVGIIVGMGMRR